MIESPALIALAAAYAGDPRGTPAGNALLSQEQLAYIRAHKLSCHNIKVIDVLISTAPPCMAAVPDEHRAQAQLIEMPCPVIATKLVGSEWEPIVVLPNGETAMLG